MSARPYHKRYHSDALSGFMALTLEERGAYQTLLDMMYDRQGPILDNDRLLAGYMQVSIRKWRSIRETLFTKGKIYAPEDGLLYNFRVKKEIENDAKTSRKHAENGSKGGLKAHENDKNTNENNEGDQARLDLGSSLNQSPESRVQSSDTKVSGASPPIDPVKVLFDLGVQVLTEAGLEAKQARSMIGKWRKDYGEPLVTTALLEARAKVIANPVEWIPKRLGSRPAMSHTDYLLRRSAGAGSG